MRVLVVDDAASVRQRLLAALRKAAGVDEVAEAASGEEALAALEDFEPDLITLDLMLPDMNGMEILEAIRQRDVDVKVVVFTNYPYATFRRRSLALGADHFFSKTTDLEQVFAEILDPAEGIQNGTRGPDPGGTGG